MEPNVVLVTGGSGMLGQQVVKHIDMFVKGVTEIRVFDCQPYENKLDFKATVCVKSITGDITDRQRVREACRGVKCVFHLVSIIDISMFPNQRKLKDVNIGGTENIINACKEEGVERLIYCGSASAFYDGKEISDGTEDTVPFLEKCPFGLYGETKRQALQMVIKENGSMLENGKVFQTAAIIPPGIYGEQDTLNIPHKLRFEEGTHFRALGKTTVPIQFAYAGNVAMMFVLTYTSMLDNKDIGGQYFFAGDDTPLQNAIEFRHIYIPAANAKVIPSSFYIPQSVLIAILTVIYYFLLIIRLFVNVNCPVSPSVVEAVNTKYILKFDKAEKRLGYKPLYDYQTSVKRTKTYFADLKKHIKNE